MEQLKIIEKVKNNSLSDDNVSAVLMYGSFTKGEGDKYSDVEFYIFLKDISNFNSLQWVNKILPVKMFFTNEFGTEVAVFENMIRGEFHFHNTGHIEVIKTWEGELSFKNADKMNLVDKDMLLTNVLASIKIVEPVRNTPENIEWIAQSIINNMIMTGNLLKRKEFAHAHQSFVFISRYILLLIRIVNNSTNHWENATKNLENEIPLEWYIKYKKTLPCLDEESLKRSFSDSVSICGELFDMLHVPDYIKDLLNNIL